VSSIREHLVALSENALRYGPSKHHRAGHVVRWDRVVFNSYLSRSKAQNMYGKIKASTQISFTKKGTHAYKAKA
jgi:hypothetical protein